MKIVRGGELHLGVNYRLAYGWDFGDNDLSLANPARLAAVESDFAEIARLKGRVLRWFVLNDGRGVMDRNGPKHWNPAALQAGLDAAQRHGLSVLLVLLDHTFSFREEQAGDSVKQGHGLWMKDEGQFERLLGQLLEPLIVDAGKHPAVLGFELMNEPEMAMRRRSWLFGKTIGVGCSLVPKEWQLTLKEMRARMSLTADVVHRTGKQFSVGSMSSRWVGQWEPVVDGALDFLNFHYYGEDHERDLDEMIETRILPLAERVAIGFGEFYPRGCECIPPGRKSTPWPDYSLTDFFSAASRHGLQLAMPWVWNPGENDPGAIPREEWAQYLRSH